MDRRLTPAEVEDLLPAYALDAVDEEERAAIEEYLARDESMRGRADELQRVATLLGYSGGAPPAEVWEKLEAEIAGRRRPRGSVPAPVVPIGRARSTPSRRTRAVAIAAAVVALAATSVVAVVVASGDDEPATSQSAVAQAAKDALRAPDARRAVLTARDGRRLATAVVLPDGTGYLMPTSEMAPLSVAETYQLWGLGAGPPISLGVLGRNPGVVGFTAAGRPDGLAITMEVAGGVPVTSRTPDASGTLSAS